MGSISLPASSPTAVPRGIYCPSITFFKTDGSDDVDIDAQVAHARYLMTAGVNLTIHGTTGEAPLLSHAERNRIVKAIAAAKAELGTETTLVIGCSAQSVREVVQMCKDAKENGGQYALVLPPSYWAAASTPAMLESFYKTVADKSPIPVIIYSFPAVTQGVDMNSDLLNTLAKYPNIVGVKLTCGNVGKLTRLTSLHSPASFSVFGGSSDWLIPGLIGGSCGAVTGLANTHPRACVQLFDLFNAGCLDKAQELQGVLSRAEWGMGRTGMNGTKYAVEFVRGYKQKVLPRAPLVECDEATKEWIRDTMAELTVYERKLEAREGVMNGIGGILAV